MPLPLAPTAYLSFRQSAAPNAAGIDNAGSKWSREAQTKFVPRGLRQDSIINGSLFYSSQGRADPAPTVVLYSSCCRSVMYFCFAKVRKRSRHTEKAVRRLFAYKSHATFLGRAAGAKAHSFGELKFPSSQTLLARNGAITASPSVAGCCGINFINR